MQRRRNRERRQRTGQLVAIAVVASRPTPAPPWSAPQRRTARRRCARRSRSSISARQAPCRRSRRATIASAGARPRRLSVSRGDVRVPGPGRAERPAGTVTSSSTAQRRAIAVEDLTEQLEGGGVDPVGVLDHHQHRAGAREASELLNQRLPACAYAAACGREVQRGVAVARIGIPSSVREQGRDLFRLSARPARAAPRACRACAVGRHRSR